MKLLIQRVGSASVTVDGDIVGKIGRGLLVLAGFQDGDQREVIDKMADKCVNLRIFEDENGKMNKSLIDIDGELLAVSQFTLYANCRKGRRPGFDNSMAPDLAENYYNDLVERFKISGLKVEHGVFGAKMEISLINDGPVTIMLDDNELFPNK